MNRILHIFRSQQTHLSVGIIQLFAKECYSDEGNITHAFMIFGNASEDEEAEYKTIGNGIVIIRSYTFRELLKELLSHRYDKIIVHGDDFKILYIVSLFCRKTIWICWGAGLSRSNSILSKINKPFKKLMLNRLYKISTLLIGDKRNLEYNYNLKNVVLAPYPGYSEDEEKVVDFSKPRNNPLCVIVGNSGHCYNSYLEILPALARLDLDFEVHCMFQYPDLVNEKKIIKELGSKLLGDRFFLDDSLMGKEVWKDYMSKCDIYICHELVQTGLGAIHRCMMNGSKIYINGSNLEWERSIGATVFDSKSIEKITVEEFLQELTVEQKIENRNIIFQIWNQKDTWIKLFQS